MAELAAVVKTDCSPCITVEISNVLVKAPSCNNARTILKYPPSKSVRSNIYLL